MPALLLEIGTEELPASACREAEAQLPELCEQHLGGRPDELYVGPRRLAVLLHDVSEREEDRWIKGPPAHLRERAAEGFARRHGVSVEALKERGGFLGLVEAGRPLRETLAGRVDAIVAGLAFPKTMRWDASGRRFPRPIRWLCAKLDDETIEGGRSYGHRFTHGHVDVPTATAYVDVLRAADVEPDARERERAIREGLDRLGAWEDPLGVLAEVVYLVERPLVLEGTFDERFLELPDRVVATAMQSHQRYFPLGRNRFGFVANGGDPTLVRAGNERVLEARLDDAAFTFERDVARGIDALVQDLGAITFFAGAGTFADKTARLEQLVERLGGGDASREAARLAKADQAAELVREFPDLDGYIGAEYARLAGYPEAVCAAIEEHYLPDSAGGPLPATEVGRILAAAEKIDNLTVAFSLGRKPTGSRDPFGLRRDAIGLCRLALQAGLEVPLELLEAPVRDFVLERLEGLLDVPVEFVRAARRSAAADVGAVAGLAERLARADPGAIGPVYTAYTRADRLAGRAGEDLPAGVDAALLVEKAERRLAETLARAEPRIGDAVARRDFDDALLAAAELAEPVDRFFEDVLVMADDRAVRGNRLRLLLEVRDALGALGDLSQLPG